MSNLKHKKLKQWLIFSSVVFGVSFGINYAVNRDVRKALVGGGASTSASSIGVLALDWRQRKLLTDNFSSLQEKIETLEKRHENLTQSHTEKTSQLKQLTQQRTEVIQDFNNIKEQKQQLDIELEELRQQKTQLDNEILEKENHTENLRLDNEQLEQQRQELNNMLNLLRETEQKNCQDFEDQSLQRQSQIRESQHFIEGLTTRTSELEAEERALNELIEQLSNLRLQLETDISALQFTKEQLAAEITETEDQLKALNELQGASDIQAEIADQLSITSDEQPGIADDLIPVEMNPDALSLPIKKPSNPEISISEEKEAAQSTSNKGYSRLNFNLKNANHSQEFWENEILPKWQHADRPLGFRFLGSVGIDKDTSNYLLQVIGENLRRLKSLTYNCLYQEFDEPQQNWLKLLTLALSEYAYYYSEDRFWDGFCERLDIPSGQAIEKTLRRIVSDGTNTLGLIKSQSGYTYVSTLWLQSGIPKHNLNHFAQLVQEVSDDYGWWGLAHSDEQELSQALMEHSLSKHASWGTLNNFLKVSCAEQSGEIALSGQLVRGIAMVAQQLEQQGYSPQALLDPEHREAALNDYYLPSSFFLRDWSTVAEILTPKPSEGKQGLRRRQRELSLQLDIETLNTQLVLPEQKLWQKDWRDLRGTFCQITEGQWEGIIPYKGDLEIPELSTVVNSQELLWEWHLQNHLHHQVLTWQKPGIDSEFPCLVFDFNTGEHIPLTLSSPVIAGTTSIICFVPKDWLLEVGEGIEIWDEYLPTSLHGWIGQEIELIKQRSSISLSASDSEKSIEVIWQSSDDQSPILQGTKLRGKKPVYLGKPVLQYPSNTHNQTVNLLIESITQKAIVARQLVEVGSREHSISIELDSQIDTADVYEMKVWTDTQEWGYSFEVKAPHQLNDPPEHPPIKINHSVPVVSDGENAKVQTTDQFWADDIGINGLWPLETVTFYLRSAEDNTTYTVQADSIGKLTFGVATLYGHLPESEQYTLAYQRVGFPTELVLSYGNPDESISWELTEKSIVFSHLNVDATLLCWNLLLPTLPDEEMSITATGRSEVLLPKSSGIYYLQLKYSHALTPLGWWCGDDQPELPDKLQKQEIQNRDAIENYCYTLLDNEPLNTFTEALDQLSLDLCLSQLESGLTALENLPNHLPDWLDKELLIQKLVLLRDRAKPKTNETIESEFEPVPENPEEKNFPATTSTEKSSRSDKWYLVTLRAGKQKIFLTCLDNVRHQNISDVSHILSVRKCREEYKNLILLQVESAAKLAEINHLLRQVEGFQSIERRPLKISDVERMLEDEV
ncbi:hypothetical protein SPB21_31525 [Leptothoe sp. ISB3NOV94-8A]